MSKKVNKRKQEIKEYRQKQLPKIENEIDEDLAVWSSEIPEYANTDEVHKMLKDAGIKWEE